MLQIREDLPGLVRAGKLVLGRIEAAFCTRAKLSDIRWLRYLDDYSWCSAFEFEFLYNASDKYISWTLHQSFCFECLALHLANNS